MTLPGGLPCMAYAESLAISVFGTSLAQIFPPFPDQDASEDEFQRYYDAHASASDSYECSRLSGNEALCFFDRLGWDFANGHRRYSRLGSVFGPLVEGLAKGWFGPAPLAEIEAWRRLDPELRALSIYGANDSAWLKSEIDLKTAD